MKKTLSSISKKTVALALAMLMVITFMPFASVSMKADAASRATVVSYMRSMATIKWSSSSNITYWNYVNNSNETRKYSAGVTYTGMPYTQLNRKNLNQFQSQMSGTKYIGPTTYSGYYGNDCSWSVRCSWDQISNGVSFSYTGNMFPGSGTGVRAVGSYNSNSTTSTKTITTGNGTSTMYSSYAQLKPGDAIVARVNGVVNHTRLVVSVSGSGASGTVTVIEQCGLSSSRGNTTWNVDKTYTFSQLYSTYYIPITCDALKNASLTDAPPTGPSQLKIENYNTPPANLGLGKSYSIYGTITSNYNIKSVTVGIYNASGTAVSAKTVNPKSTYFSVSSVDSYIKFGQAKAGTNKYKITATDEKGTKTLVDKNYTVGSSGGGSDAASTLSVSGYNFPTTLAQGKSFSIKGTVSSNYNITSLTVGIYNANGGAVSTKTVSPNAKSYSIANVDSYVKFGKASAGTNYYRIKATDQKVTKTLVDKAYTVTGSGTPEKDVSSTLTIKDYNYPTSLKKGQSYSIKGTVSSNYNITSLTVGVYDANMSGLSTKTVTPNCKTYSIETIDAYIKFNKSNVGTNYYVIKATDQKQTKTLVKTAYTVASTDPASTLTVSGANTPTTLKQGQSFTIKGTVTSNYAITKVTVGIYNSNGTALSEKSATPNAKSYNIANIDAYVKFGVAPVGTNYYKIVASDTKTSNKTLVNAAYKVTGTAEASTLSISGHNVPTSLNQGQSFSIKGTIKSNYKITSVTVGIYNANGGAISTKTVNPNSTSFNVASVDSDIVFGKAAAGKNYYKISATDQQTTKQLVNQEYTVVSNSPASTLSLSGHSVPGTLAAGASFTVKGTVSSNYNITSLTVGIYNANGGEVSAKTVSPNAKSYDIGNLDKYIIFGKASAGTNYYRVVATDAKGTKTLLNHAYTVQGATEASTLSISGHNVPGTMYVGSSFSIYGTVSSNYNITSLTVGIYSANGAAVSTKTVTPNAKSYSIKNLDAYIKFGSAGIGTNYYKVVATDAKGTKTLVNQAFEVQKIPGAGEPVKLDVPDYKQFDSRWSDYLLGKTSDTNIGRIGCTTTSIAMCESYRTGTTIYPDAMAAKISYTDGGAVAAWPSGYSNDWSNPYGPTVVRRLQEGKPTIFCGLKPDKKGQHWIVIVGYTGGDMNSPSSYIINDPGSSYRTKLSEYFEKYPYYRSLLVYN